MQTIFFSTSMDIIEEWKMRHNMEDSISCDDTALLEDILKKPEVYILVADYDSVAHDINKFISSNSLPKNTVVLERAPAIATGKMLISHGVRAYGNSRMLSHHYTQMIQTVQNNKVWTYPELTAALVERTNQPILHRDTIELIYNKLSQKESEVAYSILEGLTNDAISRKMGITTRTVKAHITSIFQKLHVNDRVSLVLLLR